MMPNITDLTGSVKDPPLTPEKLALLFGGLFLLVASLNLASILRDRFHADTLDDLYCSTDHDLSLFCASRALEFAYHTMSRRRAFFVAGLVLSITGTIYSLAMFDIDHSHIGFMIPGTIFMMMTAAALAAALEGEHEMMERCLWPMVGLFLVALG